MQIIGLGTLVMMPMLGNLSDKYGRKALLTVPMTLTIIPLGMLPRISLFIYPIPLAVIWLIIKLVEMKFKFFPFLPLYFCFSFLSWKQRGFQFIKWWSSVAVILAYGRTRNFFYAYYVLKTLTAMVCEGSVLCLALAYVVRIIPLATLQIVR